MNMGLRRVYLGVRPTYAVNKPIFGQDEEYAHHTLAELTLLGCLGLVDSVDLWILTSLTKFDLKGILGF